MSRNNLIVKGNVGQVEVLNQGTEKEFVSLTVCASEYVGKNDAGEPKYRDTWFNVVAFKGMASRVQNAGLKVGDYVEVAGPHRSDKVEKEDRTYINWNLILEDFEILRSKEA